MKNEKFRYYNEKKCTLTNNSCWGNGNTADCAHCNVPIVYYLTKVKE